MANPRSAWGIDIGNRALKAIKLVRDGNGQLRVDDFDVIEHETPLSNAGDNRDALIQTALANFIQHRGKKKGGGVVGVSVSGSSSLARFIKLPPVEPKKIPDIVRFEAIQQIPFPLEDVEWSYQLFQNADSPDVEVGIFAMRKELINHHLKVFTDVGLNVEVVQLNPLAIYNAMKFDQRLDGTTMIIDMGSENTDLIIADGQSIWLRSIPIGGKNFTDVLVKQFKLAFPKAEDLKRTAATSKYAKQIFQAMRPVFADLVAEVQRSVGFYATAHRESRLKKVLALGGTFRLPGLQKYLQQSLQLEVARIDNFGAGAPPDAKTKSNFDDNLLSLATAYGLAVQAMGEAQITSSLLPASIRREKQWKDKAPIFAAAAACFAVGAGVAMGSYFVQNLQYQKNQTIRDQNSAVIKRAQSLDNSWSNDVETQGAGDRQRVANVQSLLQYRDMWPGLLGDIQGALPVPKNLDLLSGNLAKIKAIRRADRDTLQIYSMASTYDTDLSKNADPNAAAPGAGAPPPAPAPAAAPGGSLPYIPNMLATAVTPGAHGFKITFELVTPVGQQTVTALKFVKESFVANLLKVKGATYYVAFADVTRYVPVRLNGEYLGRMQLRQTAKDAVMPPNPADLAAVDNAGGSPPLRPPMAMNPFGAPMGGGAAQPVIPAAGVSLNDVVTGEDMGNDTTLEVVALVAIGTPPPAPPVQPGAAPAK